MSKYEGNGRILWLDTFKGFGIFFLVFSHLIPYGFAGDKQIDSSLMISYLYSFHMPLFFFAAGFTINYRKFDSFWSFFWSKVKGILVPYASLYFVSWLYFMWMYWKGIVGMLSAPVVIKAFLYGNGTSLGIMNMSLWFLPCLFLAHVILYFLLKYSKDKSFYLLYIWILLSVIGAITSKLYPGEVPWSALASINAASIMLLGYMFRNFGKTMVDFFHLDKPFVAYSAAIVGFTLFLLNGRPGMASNYYGQNYIGFYAAVIASLIFYMYLSKRLEQSKMISYFGKNSLIVFGLHGLIISFLMNVKFFEWFSGKFNFYFEGLSLVIFAVFMVFIISIIFIEFFNRIAPFLIGKGYKKKEIWTTQTGDDCQVDRQKL
ncbi:acyltransferase family protein [Paenibacillus sp. GbtcB18]|uniref:acyltransferase family protein n=1 Tax=Paenibacillus sp. GbtcB18 TaxID=2824763 RepID=UPI0028158B9E|nr:acyltransferase family protein [Paenibacillus sp. GbtcB18]